LIPQPKSTPAAAAAAACAGIVGDKIRTCAVSFHDGPAKQSEGERPIKEAAELGEQLAADLK
jgi:hypothetical protein